MRISFLFALLFLIGKLAIAQPVKNLNTNVSYSTIPAAIAAASAADVIQVDAGTYTDNITIDKALALKGPNAGIDPNTQTRNPEAILQNIVFSVTGTPVIIDGFHISVTGTFHGLQLHSTPTTVTVQNNIFERQATTGGQPYYGISINSSSATKTIQNNKFTGSTTYGSVGSHRTWRAGIWSNGGHIVIKDNVFEKCNTDINADNDIANLTVSGNSFKQSGTAIAFGGAIAAGTYTFGANDFATNLTTIINNSSTNSGFRLDITAGTYGGTAFAIQSLANLFTIDAKMYHRGRDGTKLGLVYYVADNIYVHASTNAIIQPAIDYAKSGDIINIANKSGNGFREFLTVTKPLTFRGQSQSGTNISAPASGTGSGFRINNAVSDVTFETLTVKSYTGNGPTADAAIYGISNNNNLTVKSVTISGNTNASGIYITSGTGIVVQQSSITSSVYGIAAEGGSLTVTNNFINDNINTGILLTGKATAVVHYNSITNNSIVSGTRNLDNQTTSTTDATCNWWGSSTGSTVSPTITGSVTFVPFLTNGTDNDGTTSGFQEVPGSCDGVLPATFGSLSANINDNILKVLWTTLIEKGSSHFIVEGSTDGLHFVNLGTVKARSVKGFSEQPLTYNFTTPLTGATGLLGLSLAAAGFVLLLVSRKNRWLFILVVIAGIGLSIQSCSKNDAVKNNFDKKMYIRVAQVVTDGAVKHSKIVEANRE